MKLFDVDLKQLDTVSEQIREELLREHATNKEISRTLLLLEEVAVKFQLCMPDAKLRAKVARRYRSLIVSLSAAGDERNPITETEDWSAGTEDYYRTLILRANKQLLSYHREDGRNVVSILVHTTEANYVKRSLIGMAGGLILGALLYWVIPRGFSEWVDLNIFTVFQSIFLNAIALMAVPAVFCSVVHSITSLSSISDTGRMGTRIMILYTVTTLLAITIGFLVALTVFRYNAPLQIGDMTNMGRLANPSVRDRIIDLVPEHLLAPIMDGDILQVLIIAAVTGAAISLLGNKVEPLRVFIAACNHLFQMIIALVALLVPILTFVSVASLMLRYGLKPVPTILALGSAELFGCGVMFLLYALMVRTIGGLPALPFLRKVGYFFSRLNPQASSGEYLPKVVRLCTSKLGISERVASFSAALGSAVNMDGSAIHLVVCGVLMVKMFGGAITLQTVLVISFVAFVLSAGASAVQNSGMVSVSSLASTLGIPYSGLGVLFGVDQILDLTRTASNAIGDVAVCIIIAKMENELDIDAYQEE